MPEAPKAWTVLVYIAADVPERDMRESASDSLEQMRSVGSTGKIDIVAQADFTEKPTHRFWFPPQADSDQGSLGACIVKTLTNVNSGSKEALQSFLQWGTSNYPARNYMFIFWGHGYGLDDYDPFPKYLLDVLRSHAELYKFEPGASGSSSHLDGESLDELQGVESDLERYWMTIASSMPDFSSKTVLMNQAVGEVLRDVKAKLPEGQHLEIIGMDACNMAMAEVWYEMIGGPSIAIGSEYTIPYSSWPYDLILEYLASHPQAMPRELAAATVDLYAEYYSRPRTRERVTLSACDLEHVGQLTERMKALVDAILPRVVKPAFVRAVFHARNRTLEFETAGFIDLCNFCELLKKDLPDTDVADAADGVMQAINGLVLATRAAPSRFNISRARGIAIYFPQWIQNPDRRSSIQRKAMTYLRGPYNDLQFVKSTGWGNFLLQLLEERD
jgi:hypothetical protein